MDRNTLVRRFARCYAVWFVIVNLLFSSLPVTAWAQPASSTDFESPIIEHDVQPGGLIGGVEAFGATAVDNESVAKVTLNYRYTGETEYASLPMREIAQSSYYIVRVDTANVPDDVTAIEYYLEAEDATGNLTLKGFAFQPLRREFTAPLSTPIAGSTAEPVVKSSRRINWLYVALGVLAVGGIAALAGGDGDERNCDDGCDVRVTVGLPVPQ